MHIGFHVPVGKSMIDTLQQKNANIGQIFNGNPRSFQRKHKWTTSEIQSIRKSKIPIWIHAGYIIHFVSYPTESRKRILADMKDAKKINSPGVILHIEKDTSEFVKHLLWLHRHGPKKIKFIIEISSNQSISDYAYIIKQLPETRFQIGLDTAHLFANGVDLRKQGYFLNFLNQLSQEIGITAIELIRRIGMIHLNDSGAKFNSHRDIHAPLKQGYWLRSNQNSIREIVEFAIEFQIPMILETGGNYKTEIQWIRSFLTIQTLLREFALYRHYLQEPFHARPFESLLNQMESDSTPITNLNYWKQQPNVGTKIFDKITEYVETGTIQEYNKIQKENSFQQWKQFMKIPGVGPKHALNLNLSLLTERQQIGLQYLFDLWKPIYKTEAKQWQQILQTIFKNHRVLLMGSFRIGKSFGSDMDFLILDVSKAEQQIKLKELKPYIVKWFGNSGYVRLTEQDSVRSMDLRFGLSSELPFWTLYFGSGEEWNRFLRQTAKKQGYLLNQHGLYNNKTKKRYPKKIQTEEDIFHILHVPYVEPKQRSIILPKSISYLKLVETK